MQNCAPCQGTAPRCRRKNKTTTNNRTVHRLERGAEEDRLEASGKGRNQDQGLDTRHQSSRSGCLQDQLSNRTPNQLPTGNQRLMLAGLSAQNLEWRLRGPPAQVSFLGL